MPSKLQARLELTLVDRVLPPQQVWRLPPARPKGLGIASLPANGQDIRSPACPNLPQGSSRISESSTANSRTFAFRIPVIDRQFLPDCTVHRIPQLMPLPTRVCTIFKKPTAYIFKGSLHTPFYIPSMLHPDFQSLKVAHRSQDHPSDQVTPIQKIPPIPNHAMIRPFITYTS